MSICCFCCDQLKLTLYCLFAEIDKRSMVFQAKTFNGKIDGMSSKVLKNIVLFQPITQAIDNRVGVTFWH